MKGGGKRKVLNDAVVANDENENQENIAYQSIDVTDEHRENQEQEKEKENEEEENNEEENEEEEEEDEDEEAPQDDTHEDRPKLDEGFFEIEAIRRRRIRKVTFFALFLGSSSLEPNRVPERNVGLRMNRGVFKFL